MVYKCTSPKLLAENVGFLLSVNGCACFIALYFSINSRRSGGCLGGRQCGASVRPCSSPRFLSGWAPPDARRGVLAASHFPSPRRFSVFAEIPLFKGKIISFCSIGLDQRQISELQNKASLRWGRPACWQSRGLGFIPFPGLEILMPWKPQQENPKCFPKTNTPIMHGTGPWQTPPASAGTLAPAPPRGAEGPPVPSILGAGLGTAAPPRHSVKASFLHLELSSLYYPTPLRKGLPARFTALWSAKLLSARLAQNGKCKAVTPPPSPGGALAESSPRRYRFR